MKGQIIIVLIVFCIGQISCSSNHRRGMEKNLQQSSIKNSCCDSIFLLSISNTDNDGFKNIYSYYLDTINNKVSVVDQCNLTIRSYRCFTIDNTGDIRYFDDIEGNIKLSIQDGLIKKRTFLNTNRSVDYEYDDRRRLKKITYVGGEQLFSWRNDCLNKSSYIDSTSNRFNQIISVQLNSHYLTRKHSPGLLHRALGNSWDEYLFTFVGLYGKQPKGNDFIIEYNTHGYEFKKTYILKEEYSNDDNLYEEYYSSKNKKEYQKKDFNWNISSVCALLKMLKI